MSLRKWLAIICICPVAVCANPLPLPGSDETSLHWDVPATDSCGAIPLGNGDIGISVWAERDGAIRFLIGKTDAYDENNTLLKLNQIKLLFTPNPFAGKTFRQTLRMDEGRLVLRGEAFECHLWVDANAPVIKVAWNGEIPRLCRVTLQPWRLAPRDVSGELTHSDAYRQAIPPRLTIREPDVIVPDESGALLWYHHNRRSVWPDTMALQELPLSGTDPLLHRISGGRVFGDDFTKINPLELESSRPLCAQRLEISALTIHPATPEEWRREIRSIRTTDWNEALEKHLFWWKSFQERSFIRLRAADEPQAAVISQQYAVQRYLVACGGRGKMWTKFNGSIFTLPWENKDPDYRRWGGAQWFQNARLIYWPCLANGDFDMIAPFFRQFLQNLPRAKERTRLYYGHEGAFFPETQYFWGTYANSDYGWDRRRLAKGEAQSRFIKYYWDGCLELAMMMLERYEYTSDRAFLEQQALPLISAFLEFYDLHWKRGTDGKICFEPSMALETYQTGVTDALPPIAGLHAVLDRLATLPSGTVSPKQMERWARMRRELPELPEAQDVLLPARVYRKPCNSENPELYAVFPYRLFGTGRPRLKMAQETFFRRKFKMNFCWGQNEIQAALLGLRDVAAKGLLARSRAIRSRKYAHLSFSFPGMRGPHNDEIPDMDHGGAGQMALQSMLMQCVGDKIYLLPAWPENWDVSFKLHAPRQTTVWCDYRNGAVVSVKTSPAEREKDLVYP